MNVDTGIWEKLTRVVIVLIVIACLLGIGFWYLPLIKHNQRMRTQVERLDEQIQKETENAKALKSAIETQRNDPKAVERLAREKLGYAKPGETVVRFEAPATNAPSRQ